ncbi:MAG: 4a-hydroxytetrahydrobiopterin dehydratase [Planctomycetota bacterium]
MTKTELTELKRKLEGDWLVVEEHHLERTFIFPNFRKALAFTNRVGELAEEMKHHPTIELAWGRVKINIWTHKINGLTESDFIFAAKADRLYPER